MKNMEEVNERNEWRKNGTSTQFPLPEINDNVVKEYNYIEEDDSVGTVVARIDWSK